MDRKKIDEKVKKFLDYMEKECPQCLEKMEKCCDPNNKQGCC